MRDGRTIWYRGARYQLGQAQQHYAIWAADGPPSRPLEQWPQTPAGWSAAWSRFTAVEQPGTIAHLAPPAEPPGRVTAALALLAGGVVLGIAGLFPAYMSGLSLAAEPFELVPHVIYLAAWTAGAVLIAAGGGRRRAGMLLGLGTSIVTFGFFLADVGTVIAGPATLGAGLVISLAGWLACTAGSVVAFRYHREVPRTLQGLDRRTGGIVLVGTAAALGTAIAFAPSWDSYTLNTASGLSHYVTQGNAFANPALVIAGNVAVMVTLVVVALIAVLWRPARLGAALLAGAIIPMLATAISALVQVGEPVSSSFFGIPPAQATQLGLTIKSGLTPAFWIYCAFLVALALTWVGMLFPARPPWLARPAAARPAGAYPAGGNPAGGPPAVGYPAGGPPAGYPAPGQAAPGQAAPGQPAPGQPAPGQPGTGQAASGQPGSAQAASGPAAAGPGQPPPGHQAGEPPAPVSEAARG